MAHPDFSKVLRTDVEKSDAPRLGRTAKYTANLENFLLEREILTLDLRLRLDGTGRGATLSDLQAFAAQHRICSARRVSLLVSQLVGWKRVKQVPSPEDGRVRQLIPCAPLRDYQVNCQLKVASYIKIINPASTLFDILSTDSKVMEQFILADSELFHQGLAAPLHESYLFSLVSHDAGIAVLHALLRAALSEHGDIRPGQPFRISQSKIAEEFGISRSHIRNFIEIAVAHQLLVVSAKDRTTLALTEQLIRDWSATVALMMVRADQAARILDDPAIVAFGRCLDALPVTASRPHVH